MEINCQKIHPQAILPTKVIGNIGIDLHVVKDKDFDKNDEYLLKPKSRKIFHTGLKIAIPDGYGAIIKDRSSMGAKNGIHVLAGVIDSSYRGEWMVCLLNTNHKSYYVVEVGDRIAQVIIVPDYYVDFTLVDNLEETSRGELGFGSSGK